MTISTSVATHLDATKTIISFLFQPTAKLEGQAIRLFKLQVHLWPFPEAENIVLPARPPLPPTTLLTQLAPSFLRTLPRTTWTTARTITSPYRPPTLSILASRSPAVIAETLSPVAARLERETGKFTGTAANAVLGQTTSRFTCIARSAPINGSVSAVKWRSLSRNEGQHTTMWTIGWDDGYAMPPIYHWMQNSLQVSESQDVYAGVFNFTILPRISFYLYSFSLNTTSAFISGVLFLPSTPPHPSRGSVLYPLPTLSSYLMSHANITFLHSLKYDTHCGGSR